MSADRLLAHFDRIAEAPGAVPRLRRLVLDLAVRGRLVRQDPKDEPAAELLKRIAKEKARLAKEGRTRKAKSVPALMERDLPFSLPANWMWVQIAQIGVLGPRNEAADNAQASFVPMSMIAADYGAPCGHEVRQWGEIKKGYTHFAEGDVGIAKITPCFQNGKSTVFRNLTGGLGSGTTELHTVRPLFVEPDFIVIFLKNPYFIEAGIPKMTGTAGQKRVPAEYFAGSPFPLPPLAEQRRIVARVDELMALCDRLEAARAKREETRERLTAASLARLGEPDPEAFSGGARFALSALPALAARPGQISALRRLVLDLAVRGRLVRQDPKDEPAAELLKRIAKEKARLAKEGKIRKSQKFPDGTVTDKPFELPENWLWARIRQISSDRGQTVPKTDFTYIDVTAIDKEKGIVASPNVMKANEAPSRARKIVREGDVVYSCVRPYLLNIAIVDAAFDPPPIASTAFAILDGHGFVLPRFQWIALRSPFMISCAKGKMRGQAYPAINDADFARLPFPLPPLAEQRRIVARVDELMALCDRLEERLEGEEEAGARLLDALAAEATGA